MKKLFFICLLSLAGAGTSWAQQQIVVSNPSTEVRSEILSIPFDKFEAHFKMDTVFTLKDASGNVLPHQIERLGTTEPVNVLISVDIQPQQSLVIQASEGLPATKVTPKTYARYVPERFDDFAWENDVVAFRMYGKALEGRADDAQGMDYWAKRTNKLVINEWYKTEDYHKDHGQGMDYYSVGQSLGLGDMGLYINNKLTYTKHYRTYKILDNGPLRTTFRLEYDSELIDGQSVTISKTISLDAGSNFNKIVLSIDNSEKNFTPIAIGIVKRKEENPLLTIGKSNSYLTYWEPEINSSGRTGVAVIFAGQRVGFNNERPEQVLLMTTVKNDKDFVYYNGAAWDRAGKITNKEAWNQKVEQFQNNIRKPLKVELK